MKSVRYVPYVCGVYVMYLREGKVCKVCNATAQFAVACSKQAAWVPIKLKKRICRLGETYMAQKRRGKHG